MKELQALARRLLASGEAQVVIGYEQGPRGVRPVFVTAPEQADRLVFDARCVQDLAAYLSPRRPHVRKLGRPAVVVKGCDARAVAGLIREAQLKREDAVLIGVRCGGVFREPYGEPHGQGALTAESVAPRCVGCTAREPGLRDHLVGEPVRDPPAGEDLERQVDALLALPVAERLEFWKREFAKCVRCHACRQACPLCVCERCVADKTQPQWIESSAHPRANWAWNLTRAQHLAGRCAGCGECERACPEGIPLMLLNRFLARVARETFGAEVSDDPSVPAPIGAFRKDDAQEFIV